MKLKLLFILFFLSLVASGLHAQDVVYHYDSAGNRTERVIVLKSANIAQSEVQEQQVFDEMLAEQEIKIYPNPTKGLLSVSISNPGNMGDGLITVTDLNGRMLLTKRIESELTPIDLSGQPGGYYLMKIVLGTETSTWKIIKQ